MKHTIDIANLLPWGAPQLVSTKVGPRVKREAMIPDRHQFWTAWRQAKPELKAAGIAIRPLDPKKSKWGATWWQEQVVENIGAKIAASWAEDSTLDIPQPEGWQLMPFQRAGVAFVWERIQNRKAGSLIADQPGLGKTPQATCVINLLPDPTRVLVICPASLKLNWRNELNRWLTHDLPVHIIEGRKAVIPERGIVVMNYDLLTTYAAVLREGQWDLVIADESHFIKSKDAARTKALRDKPGIVAGHWLFLTGTPILNKPVDLWTQVSMCEPSMFGNWYKFATRYNGLAMGRFGQELGGPTNLDELNDMLRGTCMVRRLKDDVLDLPAKRYQVVEMPGTAKLGKLLNRERQVWEPNAEALQAMAEKIADTEEVEGRDAVEGAIEGLSPSVVAAFDEMSKIRSELAGVKAPHVAAHIQTTLDGGEPKVIVMCHHHQMVEALRDTLADYNPVTLYGPTTHEDRQAAVDRFQTDPDCRVFIGTIRAAGVGITLTAASHLIFAEQDWVFGWMDQAADRLYRIGQTKSVLIQVLVLPDSLDAHMARTWARKMRMETQTLNTRSDTQEHKPQAQTAVTVTIDQREATAQRERHPYEFADADRVLLRRCLALLVSYDADMARDRNNMGFSKTDSMWGRRLADLRHPTQGQLLAQARLAWKYRRQLTSAMQDQVAELGRRIADAAARQSGR